MPTIRPATLEDAPVLVVMAHYAAISYGGEALDNTRLMAYARRLMTQDNTAVAVVEIETGLVGFLAAQTPPRVPVAAGGAR